MQYIVSNLETKKVEITNLLIEKYELQYQTSKDEAILRIEELFVKASDYLKERLDFQIVTAIKELPSKEKHYVNGKLQLPQNVIPPELLHEYLIKQINHIFKNELREFATIEDFEKETENEETAFFLNINSLIVSYYHNLVKEHAAPHKLLADYNERLFDLEEETELIKKLSGGGENKYLNHLRKGTNYLHIKANSTNAKQEEQKLIISEVEITELYEKLSGILWDENILFEDFVSFWRLGRKSMYLPIKDRMQTAFVFLLYGYFIESLYTQPKFTQTQLEEAFNLNNIKSLKHGVKNTSPAIKKVKELMKQPKYSLKKLQW